ncbi:unnamed protein product [Protopolystoma xenopodis]|uniref:RETREG1-3/ARL6IP-like N-terminal reticulon-homology domain-containing protein n=1 Tax=Protopolystoma xenopodis TaxID=117903 RepID=A0A448X7Y8_9PLAT|nr:unnamed protein product [Protopolystoma xenopodis]
MSIPELSAILEKGIKHGTHLLSRLAHFRQRRRLLFFLLSSSVSIACILIGMRVSGLIVTYTLMNLALILPSAIHHGIFMRAWLELKPYIAKLEDEFDRRQLEEPSKREAEEAEFWEPIAKVYQLT